MDKISDTPMTLGQIAAYIGGKVIGNPHISVKGLVSPEKSGEKTLSVVWEEKELGIEYRELDQLLAGDAVCRSFFSSP